MYKIGKFVFEITGIDEKYIPENFKKFKSVDQPVYYYHIDIVDDISITHKQFTVNKPTIKVHIDNELETRYLNLPGDTNIYAKCEEIDNQHTMILFHKNYLNLICFDTIFSSLFLLERRMYQYNHYILHSSYIVYHHQAILFTAPSGTGKSTQASLWEKYRNIKIINGDRTLLTKEENRYYANGWPVCGSSEICHNQSYPIMAIVMLDQGPTNEIKQLSYFDKTKRLVKEITVNFHNQNYVNRYFEFIDQLINNIPIIHLSCTISEDAVNCLDNYLKEVVLRADKKTY